MKEKLTVNTLAFGNLKNRKKQYTSLIIGIILAMMFSSAIPLLFSSMLTSVKEMECDLYGRQNGIYVDASNQLFAEAAGEKVVGDYGFAHVVGSVLTDDGTPYSVAYLDDKAYQLSNISFIEGSYPQNENEIAIEEATIAKMGLDVSVGDSITLDFLVQDGSGYLPETKEKTFILSGIAKNKLSNIISSHSTFTDSIPSVFVSKDTQVEPGGKEKLVCYFNYYEENSIYTIGDTERYSKFSDFLDNNGGDLGNWMEADSSNYSINSSNGIYAPTVFISAFVGILLVASCLGIINAFSTNLNERRRQIGMLRTVGATKRQIIIIFGREAFIISLICVPVSIALSCLCVKVGFMILGDRFIFDANIWAIVACAVISVICVMLAALVPLIKAARVTPVQTVRNIEMTRKYVRKKIKSKKQFVPSKLIARRSLLFNGKTRAAASIILVITIIGSCFGFSFVKDMREDYWLPKYEYELESYSWDNDLINLPGSDNNYTYSDYNTVKSIPYAGDVYASRRCKAVINCGEYTDYQKTIMYAGGGYFSMFDISSVDVHSLTSDNLDSVLSSNLTEQFSALRNYCSNQDVMPIYIVALDSRQFTELESSVVSGSIDTASLDSGEEVVVIAPQKIALNVEYDDEDPDSGYSWGPDCNDGVKDDKNYLKRANCDIQAGDEISLSIISDNSTNTDEDINSSVNTNTVIYTYDEELMQEYDYSNTSSWEKTDANATVGAVVNELPYGFFDANNILSSADIVVLTTLSGMKNFYSGTNFSNIDFNLNTECNDEIDADISNTLQSIIDKKDDCIFNSYYTIIKDQQQTNSAVLILLTAIIILLMSISASIINNSLTAQIRDGRREIGTLRAVGASARDLFGSYISQLVSILSISYAVGFVLFIVSYFINQAVTNGMEREQMFKFSIWETVVACALLFIFCAVNLWLKIKKEMKHSVIDNIREL